MQTVGQLSVQWTFYDLLENGWTTKTCCWKNTKESMAHMSRSNRIQMCKLLAELVQNGTGLLSTSHPVQCCAAAQWKLGYPLMLWNSRSLALKDSTPAKKRVFSTPKCGFPSEPWLQDIASCFAIQQSSCTRSDFLHGYLWLVRCHQTFVALLICHSKGHCWHELIQFHSEFYVIEVKKLEANLHSWPFMSSGWSGMKRGDIHLSIDFSI